MSSTRWQISLPFSNSENQSEMKKNADNPIFFLSIICKKTRYFVCLATKKLPIGEPSILTLVERQSQRESRVCQSSSLRVYETLSH